MSFEREPQESSSNSVIASRWNQIANLLRALYGILRKVASGALMATVLLTACLAMALFVAPVFGRTGSLVFEEYVIRWTLVVFMFFLGGLVVFSDRIFAQGCNRVTMAILAVLILHLLYAVWFHLDPETSSIGYTNNRGSYTYFLMTVALTLGVSVWLFFRTLTAVEHGDEVEKNAPRFSIGSTLIWFFYGALLLALIQRNSAFPVPIELPIVTEPGSENLVALLSIFLLVPLTTWYLMRTRHYFRTVASILIIVFAGSWIAFGLIGLQESEYRLRDQYLVKIASFSYATLVYLLWLGVMKQQLFRCNTQWRMHDKSQTARNSLTLVGGVLWAYLFIWLVMNVAMPTANRDSDWVDCSPKIKQMFREVFGEGLVEQLDQRHRPESTRDWINCLARHEIPQEKDVLFQIARIAPLRKLDGFTEAMQRKAMGFSQEQIDALPEEFPLYSKVFLFAAEVNLSHKVNKLLLEQYKSCCQEIRDAIARSEGACFILTDAGWTPLNAISDFAFDTLLGETLYAIKAADNELALENVAAIAKFSTLLSRDSLWQPHTRREYASRAIAVLLYVANKLDLQTGEANRLLDMAELLAGPKTQTDAMKALAFANTVLVFRNYIEDACPIQGKPLLGSLINDCPRCIDWSEFVFALEKLNRNEPLHDDLSLEMLGCQELIRLKLSATTNEASRFHDQAIDILALPGLRSRRLARHCMKWRRNDDLRIQNWIQMRLSLVALKLMLYRNEHGRFPLRLNEIEGPITDPYSGKLLAYWPSRQRFELFSRGPDEATDSAPLSQGDDIAFQWPDWIVQGFYWW